MGELLNMLNGRETEIALRRFEKRDIDSIFKWKNDKNLLDMIIGHVNTISREEAALWVDNCMKGDRPDLKFWAICTNDNDRRIVGWESISEIDLDNKSACHHGLVIGDPEYKDGTAMFEAMLYAMDYAFSELKIHRLYGSCLAAHKTTPHLMTALGFVHEGIRREAYYKDNTYFDLNDYSILENEFFQNINNGSYELTNLFKKFLKSLKNK